MLGASFFRYSQYEAISGKPIVSMPFPRTTLPGAAMGFWELVPRGLHWTRNGRQPYASPATFHAGIPPRLSSARHIASCPALALRRWGRRWLKSGEIWPPHLSPFRCVVPVVWVCLENPRINTRLAWAVCK